jgi:hypothetical protein
MADIRLKKLQCELEQQKECRALEEVKIEPALERWLSSKKDEADVALFKYRTTEKEIASWVESRGLAS